MGYMKRLLEEIKFWMDEYEKENGKIHDDEYEKIFMRMYLKAETKLKKENEAI